MGRPLRDAHAAPVRVHRRSFTRHRRPADLRPHTGHARPAPDLEGRAMDLTPQPPARTALDPDRFEPPLPSPTRGGLAFAVGLASAVLLYCSARAFGKSYSEAFFCSPFFVGAVVGLLGPRRPIRNSLYPLLAALVLAVVTLHEGVVCIVFSLPLI